MNKYKIINGKIRHAHAPVGPNVDYDNESMRFVGEALTAQGVAFIQDVMMCGGCGYHVCSCPPKPKRGWVYARELDMLVYDYLDGAP